MQSLVTVVTVCFNSERTIAKTIESVLEQECTDFEYLIIDGGSKDRTIEIIKEYESAFKGKLRWISEKDNGWYDAMNKGIHLSKGRFINFLNSDDYFASDAIKLVCDYIRSNSVQDDEIIYGDSTNIYRDSKGKKYYKLIQAPNVVNFSDNALKNGMCGIRHQSMFTGRSVFKKIGDLNLKYRLHADWDFLVKCVKNGVKMYHINKNLTFYSMYGASTNPNYIERHMLRKDNGLYKGCDLYYLKDRWGLKVLMKKILGEQRWNDLLFRIHEMRGK